MSFTFGLGLAWAQLRDHRDRTLLVVCGVALAVLLVTLLLGLGWGLLSTGGAAIEWINRDLWVRGGGLAVEAGSLTGIESPIEGVHTVAADIERDERVVAAQPISLMTVYISPNGSNFSTTIGVGSTGAQAPDVTGTSTIRLDDRHYANGTNTGPMTREVIISPRIAEQYDIGVNDTLYIGGTVETSRRNEFRVIAVSGRYSTFLGASTVALPLSELQAITGTTGADRAGFIGVTLAQDADPAVVTRDIERRHPELTVRGNAEEVRRIIGRQTAVVVGVLGVVVLAVGAGVTLVVNVLATFVRAQRQELAALLASGVSTRSLVQLVFVEGVLLGALGGLTGLVLAPVAVELLNPMLASLSGFPNLIKLAWWVYPVGGGLAVTMGVLGSTVAGRQVAALSPLEHLR